MSQAFNQAAVQRLGRDRRDAEPGWRGWGGEEKNKIKIKEQEGGMV